MKKLKKIEKTAKNKSLRPLAINSLQWTSWDERKTALKSIRSSKVMVLPKVERYEHQLTSVWTALFVLSHLRMCCQQRFRLAGACKFQQLGSLEVD